MDKNNQIKTDRLSMKDVKKEKKKRPDYDDDDEEDEDEYDEDEDEYDEDEEEEDDVITNPRQCPECITASNLLFKKKFE